MGLVTRYYFLSDRSRKLVMCNLATRVYRGRIIATVETVLLRIGVAMEMLLHSNRHLQRTQCFHIVALVSY
jgi:hypothetical protein